MDEAPDGAKLHELKKHILEIYNNRLGAFLCLSATEKNVCHLALLETQSVLL